MALVFREAHAAPDKKRINEEWFILENALARTSINTGGLAGHLGPRQGQARLSLILGVIDPGFMLQPGEKILVVSGVPGKKSHGEPPAREGLRTYHLFQRDPLAAGRRGCRCCGWP